MVFARSEAKVAVTDLDLEATAFVLPVLEYELNVARFEFGGEVGEEEDFGLVDGGRGRVVDGGEGQRSLGGVRGREGLGGL